MVCVFGVHATAKDCETAGRPDGAVLGEEFTGRLDNDLVNDLVYIMAMAQVGIHEAKTHLSRLLRRVAAGEVIVIAKGGTPLARLVPIHSRARRDLGRDKDAVTLHDDFDTPMPWDPEQP